MDPRIEPRRARTFRKSGKPEIPPKKPQPFELRTVKAYGLPHTPTPLLPKDVEKSMKRIQRTRREELDIDAKKRRDYTHLNAYAIDPTRAFIRDDAISYDKHKNRVLVHMADPSAYFRHGRKDTLVRHAMKNSETVYLTTSQLPMFPLELSNRRFSLSDKRSSIPALTFGFKIRRDGSIRTSSITVENSYIKVTTMSYGKATDAIEKRLHKDLVSLHSIARKMKQYRDEVSKGPGHPRNPSSGKEGMKATGMVEALMTGTKIAAGHYATKQKIPVLYEKTYADRGDRNNNKKRLSVHGGRHDGVGADGYVGVTCPLREAGDLVNHMQIKASLRGGKTYDFSRRELDKFSRRHQRRKDTIKRAQKRIYIECNRRGYKNCNKRNA